MTAAGEQRPTEAQPAPARGIALVTGASRGIGRASALALASAGYDVVACARTMIDGERRLEDDESIVVPGGIDTTVDKIRGYGRRALGMPLDLLDRASIDTAIDNALEHFGRIDVVVNNAIYQGPGAMVEILDVEPGHLEPMFEANVHAQIHIIQRCLPGMLAHGSGTVVNMISATAHTAPPARIGAGGWGVAYAMTKAALARVAPILHVEHGDQGVLAFSVDPGFVINERMVAAGRDRVYREHAVGVTPEVIGAVVAWLATDPEAAELTGQTVMAQREFRHRGLTPGPGAAA